MDLLSELKALAADGKKELDKAKSLAALNRETQAKLNSLGNLDAIVAKMLAESEWKPTSLSFVILHQTCSTCGGESKSSQGLFVRQRQRSGATRVVRRPWDESFFRLPISKEIVHEDISVCPECFPLHTSISDLINPQPQMELF